MSARNTCFLNALAFVLIMVGGGATALAQQTPSGVRPAPPPKPGAQAMRVEDRKPAESKPPAAQYDIGHIVKRIPAVEAQVAELKKKNAALEAQIIQMKLIDSLASKKPPSGINTAAGDPTQDRLKKLEDTVRNHTHYMPNIGVMALNALPGMQEIANKSGVGHVLQQWKDIKMHVSFGSGGGLDRTGLPIIPGQ